MNDEQKQIEEMAYSVCKMGELSDYITDCSKCGYNDERDCKALKFSRKFYEAGYRKQSDTAREILQYLYEKMGNVSLSDTELVLYLAAQYGVEVEE